jgi:DNA-binding response OmpR family regulator
MNGRSGEIVCGVLADMSEEAYRAVRLVLGDPDPAFGKTVSAGLFPLGLRDISICGDGATLRQATASTVDVVACDTKLPNLDFRAFVQDVRHGRVGANPFVMMIATARNEDEAKAEGIVQSGVDELMIKPVHPLMLSRRMAILSKERKSFVMTPGYVGPSRRAARRNDGSDDNLVAVPNTLRAKMVEQKGDAAIAGMVEAGKSVMDAAKSASGIKVIVRMTRKLAELKSEDSEPAESHRVLDGMAKMVAEVLSQHEESASPHVPAIAERIAKLAARARAAPRGPAKIEIDLLAKLADAALVAAAQQANAAAAVPEIVAVVDGYLARG